MARGYIFQKRIEQMTQKDQQQLEKTLWNIADQLRGAMNADDFRFKSYGLLTGCFSTIISICKDL